MRGYLFPFLVLYVAIFFFFTYSSSSLPAKLERRRELGCLHTEHTLYTADTLQGHTQRRRTLDCERCTMPPQSLSLCLEPLCTPCWLDREHTQLHTVGWVFCMGVTLLQYTRPQWLQLSCYFFLPDIFLNLWRMSKKGILGGGGERSGRLYFLFSSQRVVALSYRIYVPVPLFLFSFPFPSMEVWLQPLFSFPPRPRHWRVRMRFLFFCF